jgi:hypothetical protein
MYKNPKGVYPNWAYSNPDHPYLIGGARAFATMLIFGGFYLVILVALSLLLPEGLSWIVAITGVFLSTRYLRPELPKPVVPEGTAATPITRKQGFLSTRGKWVVGVGVVVGIFSFCGVLMSFGNSEVCQLALQRAQSSSTVAERLGSPIKQGLFVSGSIETNGPSGHADVSIPVSGPKAKGTLYAVGSKSAGEWKFETLRLAVEGGSNQVDLLDDSSKSMSH